LEMNLRIDRSEGEPIIAKCCQRLFLNVLLTLKTRG
jgi:hypothetical protein